ncbi:MAG: hypothetical protein V4687_16595 [Bacteroidota bacterium]
MKQLFILTALSFLSLVAAAQTTDEASQEHGNTVYFVDSVRLGPNGMGKQAQAEIASINIVEMKAAMAILGEAGKNGIVYIETKSFARKRFERYFKSKSADYTKALNGFAGDTSAVQYILNGKVLDKDYEGNLSFIGDKVFKELVIISKKELSTKYSITNKQFGVAIKTSSPEVSIASPF